MKKYTKARFLMFVIVLCFISNILYYLKFNVIKKAFIFVLANIIASSQDVFTINDQKPLVSLFDGHNVTHLWSLKLADEIYAHVAHILPCRIVHYGRGPHPGKINTCDQSSTNEFSILNTLLAQKWIYEHQNPLNCSNKRFAIIHQTAPSGFGSTIHQIAWSLGIALGEDRIAVYKTPGDWVKHKI